jgi:hypothetical protein
MRKAMQNELFEWRVDTDTDLDLGDKDPRQRVSKVGEYLVAAELTDKGFDVTMAAEKLTYDLIADKSGRLLKVQVKTASYSPEWGYRFCTHRCSHKGAGRSRSYPTDDVDVFAFVALDLRAVAFMPACQVIEGSNVELSRASFQQPGLAAASLERSLASLEVAA